MNLTYSLKTIQTKDLRPEYNSVSCPPFKNLVELLAYRALHSPDQKAYTFLQDGETETNSVTYGELERQARAIATSLQSKVLVGERALLLYPPGLQFISAFFGCLYAGVVAVPAYPPRNNQNLERLQGILHDSKVCIVLTTGEILSTLEGRFDSYPELVCLQWLTTDNLDLALARNWEPPDLSTETLAFLQYTSGSTGSPKGVMVSHHNLLANLEHIKQAFELNSQSVSVTWLPNFHDMGLIDGILQPIYTGFWGISMPPVAFLQKPLRWLQAISHYRATHCGGPNFCYELCIQKISGEQGANLDLSSWESAYSGAEPVRAETLERFSEAFASYGFRREFFYPCYGMAEATLLISGGAKAKAPIIDWVREDALQKNRVIAASPNEVGSKAIVGVGKTACNQQIRIVQPDALVELPSGEVGEIWLLGDAVTRGYWNQPCVTQSIFRAFLANSLEGPFLRTGDLGFLREDGELFITGRLKDVIIIRGRNHYPQDIELTVERSHEALIANHSAAFSITDNGEEKLVVVAEIERRYRQRRQIGQTEEEFQESERRTRERRREQINPAYAVNLDHKPVFKEVVSNIRQAVSRNHGLQVYQVCLIRFGSIPKTSSGKIKRRACRQGFLDNLLTVVYPEPSAK